MIIQKVISKRDGAHIGRLVQETETKSNIWRLYMKQLMVRNKIIVENVKGEWVLLNKNK